MARRLDRPTPSAVYGSDMPSRLELPRGHFEIPEWLKLTHGEQLTFKIGVSLLALLGGMYVVHLVAILVIPMMVAVTACASTVYTIVFTIILPCGILCIAGSYSPHLKAWYRTYVTAPQYENFIMCRSDDIARLAAAREALSVEYEKRVLELKAQHEKALEVLEDERDAKINKLSTESDAHTLSMNEHIKKVKEIREHERRVAQIKQAVMVDTTRLEVAVIKAALGDIAEHRVIAPFWSGWLIEMDITLPDFHFDRAVAAHARLKAALYHIGYLN